MAKVSRRIQFEELDSESFRKVHDFRDKHLLLIRLLQLAARCSVKAVPRPPFPKSLREFQTKFASEEACRAYLALCRWPDGFVCPRCGDRSVYELLEFRRWQCVACRYQVSLTAGTVLHNTRTPLTAWFAYSGRCGHPIPFDVGT